MAHRGISNLRGPMPRIAPLRKRFAFVAGNDELIYRRQFAVYTSSRSARGGKNSREKISAGVGARASW